MFEAQRPDFTYGNILKPSRTCRYAVNVCVFLLKAMLLLLWPEAAFFTSTPLFSGLLWFKVPDVVFSLFLNCPNCLLVLFHSTSLSSVCFPTFPYESQLVMVCVPSGPTHAICKHWTNTTILTTREQPS